MGDLTFQYERHSRKKFIKPPRLISNRRVQTQRYETNDWARTVSPRLPSPTSPTLSAHVHVRDPALHVNIPTDPPLGSRVRDIAMG